MLLLRLACKHCTHLWHWSRRVLHPRPLLSCYREGVSLLGGPALLVAVLSIATKHDHIVLVPSWQRRSAVT
jgi:hypothetical protein